MSDYDYLFKVLLLGDPKEETRNLVEKYFQTFSLSDLKLTLGVDFYLRNLELDDKMIKLQIWNIFKQERFQEVTKRIRSFFYAKWLEVRSYYKSLDILSIY